MHRELHWWSFTCGYILKWEYCFPTSPALNFEIFQTYKKKLIEYYIVNLYFPIPSYYLAPFASSKLDVFIFLYYLWKKAEDLMKLDLCILHLASSENKGILLYNLNAIVTHKEISINAIPSFNM